MIQAPKAEHNTSCLSLATFWAGLFIFVMLSMLPLFSAGADGFQEDYKAIDNAAKSVLMLEVYDVNNDLIATGSGFVAYNNRTMITNYHVIEGADSIAALSDAGDYYYAYTVLAYSKEKDIAILEFISPTDLKPLDLAPKETQVFRGEPVVAIGSPEGLTNTVSLGNISAVRNLEGINEYQFTAPVSHGSSGGALFNNSGQVIGITYAFFTSGQNLNMAIPIYYAAELYANPLPKSVLIESLNQEETEVLPTPLQTQKPTAAPRANEGGTLAATLLEDGTVRLSWPDLKNKTDIFTVTSVSSLWNHTEEYTTDETTLDINGLIPGLYYDFTLQPMGSGNTYTAGLQMPSKSQYNEREFLMEEANVYWVNIDEDEFDDGTKLNEALKTTPADLLKSDDTRKYLFYITCSVQKSKMNTEFPYVLALYTPDGYVYTRWGTGDIPKDFSYFDYSFRLDSLLKNYLNDQQAFQKGYYWIELYFDGKLSAYGKFEVK